MVRHLPDYKPTVVRMDWASGKSYVGYGYTATLKHNPLLKGVVKLMWTPKWVLVIWDTYIGPVDLWHLTTDLDLTN